ncbi:hypothetical protein [Vibrio fluvialis]|uniref:hypothetical protein n=1 Tax=Vibrio fluvialis TaxID=676 RepID=UPI001EEC7EEC|nr:hypothetical protein [Vibrio fluvialis]MCG6368734.1 hypothetical protein [Vibrio fluvialis]MCG6377435.1 hypothetical protein [Vibrio fluvialis]
MNDFLIKHLLEIVEGSNSEIAKIQAIKQLSSVDLDEYFKRIQQECEEVTQSEIISEEQALALLGE